MTIDKLTEFSAAVTLTHFSFNVLKNEVQMDLVPEYGIKDDIKNKKFRVQFENCTYVGYRGDASILPSKNEMEFITWGKVENLDLVEKLILSTSAIGGLMPNPVIDKRKVLVAYMFQNPISGTTIVLVSEKVIVSEIG